MLQENLASRETTNMYKALITGSVEDMIIEFRRKTEVIFAKKLVVDFVVNLLSYSIIPNNLAFSVSDSKVFIWAEINEDDEESEDILIESEGRVNAKYYQFGYNISTTIVEVCDRIKIPSHYIIIPIKELKKDWQTSQNI